MKTIIVTLSILVSIILLMVSMSIDAESELKQWKTNVYKNESTNRIEKRLFYWYPNHNGPVLFQLVIPCNINESVKIEVDTSRTISYYYRPEWYYPRGKIRIRLDKYRTEWEAIKPENNSSWLYITAPSTQQIIQQLKEHIALRLRITVYGFGSKYLRAYIELAEFANIYDSHCN